MSNFCCSLWKSVANEIKTSYLKQLQDAEAKGVPAFTLFPQREAIEAWGEHCPRCGTSLLKPEVSKPAVHEAPVQKKPVVVRPCKACGGRKIVAGHGTDDPIKCMTCFGEGIIDERHQLDDSSGGLSDIQVPRGLEKSE